MPDSADLIAILRTGPKQSAVWHVDVAPSTPLMRLCGAWVTDDLGTLRNVVAARIVLPFGDRLDSSAAEIVQEATGVVNLNTSLKSIRDAITELDETHRAAKTAAGKDRAPIQWPDLPEPLDWASLPATPRGVNPDPFVGELVAVANWIANLAEAWSRVEVARMSKGHLAGGDRSARSFPIEIVAPAPA